MLAERPLLTFAIALVLCLGLIIGGQALANASAPSVRQLSQSAVVGQAGFAYLGGLRMMGAGLLWGRLDAQFHQYGGYNVKVQDRLDLLPSIQLVQMLNPQLELPYYYTSYILYLRGRMGDAMALAKQGIKNNPTSGLLRANYAQLLFIQNRHANLQLMLEQARIGMGPTATYTSIDNQFEAYAIFRTVYQLAGDPAKVAEIDKILAYLKTQSPTAGQSAGGFSGLLNQYLNSASNTEDLQAPSVPLSRVPVPGASGTATSTK
jgi:tetratricopeptide (TPR) repeat protein